MRVAGIFTYCHIYGASTYKGITVLLSRWSAEITEMAKPNFHPVELLLQPNTNHRFVQAIYFIRYTYFITVRGIKSDDKTYGRTV